MDKTKLEPILEKIPQSRIMVVGDIMLDEYLEGTVDRISPEAPIPVVNLVNGRKRDVRLGGAANVFNNLMSLGGRSILLCGVIGDDGDGRLLEEKMQSMGADTAGLIVDPSRPTIIKTRIIAHNQQVIRLDREERAPISDASRSRLVGIIKDRLDRLDALIFSDYEKGVITGELLEEVLPLARAKNITVAVDPKFTNFRHFKNATIIVPNRKEASGFVRHELNTEEDSLTAAREILGNLGCDCVLIKLGEHGMRFVDRRRCDVRIEPAAEQAYHVTGAPETLSRTPVLL